MEKPTDHLSFSPNYVTLVQLEQRWLKQQEKKQTQEQKERKKEEESDNYLNSERVGKNCRYIEGEVASAVNDLSIHRPSVRRNRRSRRFDASKSDGGESMPKEVQPQMVAFLMKDKQTTGVSKEEEEEKKKKKKKKKAAKPLVEENLNVVTAHLESKVPTEEVFEIEQSRNQRVNHSHWKNRVSAYKMAWVARDFGHFSLHGGREENVGSPVRVNRRYKAGSGSAFPVGRDFGHLSLHDGREENVGSRVRINRRYKDGSGSAFPVGRSRPNTSIAVRVKKGDLTQL